MSAGPSFSVTPEDRRLITAIVMRAESLGITDKRNRLDHRMDLTACHANGNPLDLQRMLDWPREFDLAHDIHGINRHIDQNTGRMRNCFLPRFTVREVQAAEVAT